MSSSENPISVEKLKEILDEKLAPLRFEVCELRQKLAETMQFLDLANSRYEEAMAKLSKHEQERKEVLMENKVLKSAVQTMEGKVQQMKKACNDLEQYSRRECVEIHGIPLPKSTDVKENTNEIVVKIGHLMGVDVKEEDISVSHRLSTSKNYKGNRSTPAIIAKFVRRDVKECYYRGRKKLKGRTTQDLGLDVKNNIYINESLTESNKNLFKDALRVKKDCNFAFAWTMNDNIYLRKDQTSPVIYIRSRDDIVKLLPR